MTLKDTKSNEFTDSPSGNVVRPYSVGMLRHDETLATILVYKDSNSGNIPKKDDIDFLKKQDEKVQDLTNIKEYGPQDKLTQGAPEQASGEISIDKLDNRNDYYGIFNNFSLLNVEEAQKQIVKLHINFGADWNAFFFGDQARIYQFSGFFIDSADYPYYQEFMVAYDKYLAGRKAIENKVRTKFIYDGKIVDGYMLDIITAQTAGDQLIKTFQFTVLVKGFHWIRTNLVPNIGYSKNGNPGMAVKEEYNGLSNRHRLNKEILNGTAPLELSSDARVDYSPPVRNS